MRSHAPKARTRQALWNVKQEKPELFEHQTQCAQLKEQNGGVAHPPGFEKSAWEGWLHNPSQDVYLETSTGRRCWYDADRNEFHDLHRGQDLSISFVGGAASSLNPVGRGIGHAAASELNAEKRHLPKHVVIPDLHRVAQALKTDFSHFDKPAAMVALFGCSEKDNTRVPADVAARVYHERLVKRLGGFRGTWSDEALGSAVIASLDEVAAADGRRRPVASITLVVGSTVVAAAVAGGRFCLSNRGDTFEAFTNAKHVKQIEHGACGHDAQVVVARLNFVTPQPLAEIGALWQTFFAVLFIDQSEPDSNGSATTAHAGHPMHPALSGDRDLLRLAIPHLSLGRPRAASVAILQEAQTQGASGSLAAVCVRLSDADGVCPLVPEPATKRRKMAAAPNKVRVRHVLLQHWRGAGAKPVDPIRRKPIDRSPELAEMQMLAVLNGLLAEGCAGFSTACKAVSECQSALKGGELIGDLGWIDRMNVSSQDKKAQHPAAIRSIVPASVRKAAFELDVGELSDLVSSDVGVHLLLRTA